MSFTIVDSIVEHAGLTPDAISFRFLEDLEKSPQELTFQDLWQEMQAIASYLNEVAEPGDRIMLFFPPGLAYIKAFFGCLLAGMVAVPLYPPRRNVKSDRIMKVAQSCQSTVALTTLAELAVVEDAWREQNVQNLTLAYHTIEHIKPNIAVRFARPAPDLAATAFLQYTSGSTGVPKGVVISHGNIMANVRHLSLMSSAGQNDVFVNWLPLFHDLGLVTAVLLPAFLGAPSNLMAPATFVRDPSIWLQAISRYRGTIGGSPNFGFDLCNKKIGDAQLAGLKLDSWRIAFNAAEPIRAETLDHFFNRFAASGFRESAFYPAYGMAEATVMITGGNAGAKPVLHTVSKRSMAEHRLEFVSLDHVDATRIVGCGNALPPHEVRIVNPESGIELKDGEVGEIWFAGPSVSPGYWQLDQLNAATFNQRIHGNHSDGGFLRTGDLGTLWQGALFVTGRIKDLIILRGRNHYPQDIEVSCANAHSAIRQGAIAAFSVLEQGLEKLVVVAEIEREYFRRMNADEVINAVRKQVILDHDAHVDQVILLRPFKIPVTSSGKIARRQTRQMLMDGELDVLAESGLLSSREMIAPLGEIEQRIAEIWCAVLEIETVGRHDNFFELGGDSVAAIEMASQLNQGAAAVAFDISRLTDFPTIAQLAQFMELTLAHANSKKNAQTTSGNKTIRI